MRALIFLVAIVLLMALAGWISFSSTPGRGSINIETQKIQADTDRALESGAHLMQKASDSVGQAAVPAGEQQSSPVTSMAPVGERVPANR